MNPQKRAHALVHQAIRKGNLIRPSVCELCGWDITRPISILASGDYERKRIMGHHWRGYAYPLDVWWVCGYCNQCLRGFHDGSLTKAQAQFVVKHRHIYGYGDAAVIRQMIEKYPPCKIDPQSVYDAKFEEAREKVNWYLEIYQGI